MSSLLLVSSDPAKSRDRKSPGSSAREPARPASSGGPGTTELLPRPLLTDQPCEVATTMRNPERQLAAHLCFVMGCDANQTGVQDKEKHPSYRCSSPQPARRSRHDDHYGHQKTRYRHSAKSQRFHELRVA